jgi:GDP-4-dehydro-6-deoxy-D-mannose reductase
MNARFLVTGAQGFLGRYAVAEILRRFPASTVTGVGRSPRLDDRFTHIVVWNGENVPARLPPELQSQLAQPAYEYLQADLLDQAWWVATLRRLRPQYILHMAAALRDEPLANLCRTNIEGTAALLEAVERSEIESPLVILGSSGAVYGSAVGDDLPARESASCAPVDFYSITKLAGEHIAETYTRAGGVRLVIARLFNLVGPGQDERHLCGRLMRQMAEIRHGLSEPIVPIGNLHTSRDFIDVRDAAIALVQICVTGTPGTYNVGSGRETVISDLVQLALKIGELEELVELRSMPGRVLEINRLFADVTRLRATSAPEGRQLDESLQDVMTYYLNYIAS